MFDDDEFEDEFDEEDRGVMQSNTAAMIKKVLSCALLLLLFYSFLVDKSIYFYAEGEAPLNNHFLGFILAAATVCLYWKFGRILAFTVYFGVFVLCYVIKFGFCRNLAEIVASLVLAAVVRYVLHKKI